MKKSLPEAARKIAIDAAVLRLWRSNRFAQIIMTNLVTDPRWIATHSHLTIGLRKLINDEFQDIFANGLVSSP